MLRFDRFLIAPDLRISGQVERGMLSIIRFSRDNLHPDFLARYLRPSDPDPGEGDILLPELPDQEGRPRPLRSLSIDQRRRFLQSTVGLVLGDGGLLDDLSIRANLLLSFDYRHCWPRPPVVTREEIAHRLTELIGEPDPSELEARPGDLDPFSCRRWGLLRALIRQPQLLIYAGILSGLTRPEQTALATLIRRYLELHPTSAHLLLCADSPTPQEILGNLCRSLS